MLGAFLRDVIAQNPDNFRIVGPDETTSNRLTAVFETTTRAWLAERAATDEGLGPDGRVMEVLSEHLCQGWLEGYLLTGRHGLFNCYEAFIHIVDSMFNQHAKWLKTSRRIPWRMPLASLNYLLTSHVWQQDHNGFSHQDPGFIDHVMNKKAEVIRVYLPPDANCLLSVMDHCLRSRNYVNVVVAGKAPALTYLTIDEATAHCTRGIGIWEWASNDDGHEPDVVMACCGDVPTLETLAAVALLREHLPELRVRVVNVVDLMRLQPDSEHPHGLPDAEFDALFTVDRPVIFAYHGYPWLIHRLTYRRANHDNLHVRGYKEEGTTTTPFDMVMLNDLDRFHLVMDVIDRVPGLAEIAAQLRQDMQDERHSCRAYTREHGEDRPDVAGWLWPADGLSSILVVNAGSTSLKLSAVDGDERSRKLDALDEAPGRRRRGRAIASSTAARAFWRPCCSTARRSPSCAPSSISRRSTTLPALAAIDDARAAFPGFRTSPCSTRSSTRRCPRSRRPTRCPSGGGPSGTSAATASTASRCSGRPSRCRSRAWSSATSAAAARSAPCATAARSTRPWASARSTASPMATRAGSVDPAAILYLLRSGAAALDEINSVLERESGLLGLSGVSGSVEELEHTTAPAARRALDLYCYRIACAVGSLAVALGGLDAIAFSGGVGEGSALVRSEVCGRLGVLGVRLDDERNRARPVPARSAPPNQRCAWPWCTRAKTSSPRAPCAATRLVRPPALDELAVTFVPRADASNSRPLSGPASNERITLGATRIASSGPRVDDLVVELDAARSGDHDVDLLGLVVLVPERLALAGLDAVEADARVLGVEVVRGEARLLDLAEPELDGGVLDIGELLERVGRGHAGSLSLSGGCDPRRHPVVRATLWRRDGGRSAAELSRPGAPRRAPRLVALLDLAAHVGLAASLLLGEPGDRLAGLLTASGSGHVSGCHSGCG